MPVKRDPPIPNRADDVYDPGELKKFVSFLKDRTRAPVPGWWADGVSDVELFPGRHHAFVETTLNGAGPKTVRAVTGHLVSDGAAASERAGTIVYAAGG